MIRELRRALRRLRARFRRPAPRAFNPSGINQATTPAEPDDDDSQEPRPNFWTQYHEQRARERGYRLPSRDEMREEMRRW